MYLCRTSSSGLSTSHLSFKGAYILFSFIYFLFLSFSHFFFFINSVYPNKQYLIHSIQLYTLYSPVCYNILKCFSVYLIYKWHYLIERSADTVIVLLYAAGWAEPWPISGEERAYSYLVQIQDFDAFYVTAPCFWCIGVGIEDNPGKDVGFGDGVGEWHHGIPGHLRN
mgnify:CR=1 FL=1